MAQAQSPLITVEMLMTMTLVNTTLNSSSTFTSSDSVILLHGKRPKKSSETQRFRQKELFGKGLYNYKE